MNPHDALVNRAMRENAPVHVQHASADVDAVAVRGRVLSAADQGDGCAEPLCDPTPTVDMRARGRELTTTVEQGAVGGDFAVDVDQAAVAGERARFSRRAGVANDRIRPGASLDQRATAQVRLMVDRVDLARGQRDGRVRLRDGQGSRHYSTRSAYDERSGESSCNFGEGLDVVTIPAA